MIRNTLLAGALATLCACTPTPSDRSGEIASRSGQQPVAAVPPSTDTASSADTCRAREVTPAVYEQVMGEVQVVQAVIDEDGTVVHPPIYRRTKVPRLVQNRSEISFEAPCRDLVTPEFIASLQRALAVRGYFAGNVTGQLDAPTTAAIRKYQSERGLDSGQLSLETARALGLVAVDRDTL